MNYLFITTLAFFCELVDTTLGGGYGTILTPVLIVLGFEISDIVPAILMSEVMTGLAGGFMHHRAGNVTLFKGRGAKILLLFSSCSIFGTIAAVFVGTTIPKFWVKLYIGFLITGMGFFIITNHKKKSKFSWKRITSIGLIASFNKGISGGGYGPLITGGQVLSGVDGKNAVGITSFAEGLVCVVGASSYYFIKGSLNLSLIKWLIPGAILSLPFGILTVKKMKSEKMKTGIGVLTTILGAITLLKLL